MGCAESKRGGEPWCLAAAASRDAIPAFTVSLATIYIIVNHEHKSTQGRLFSQYGMNFRPNGGNEPRGIIVMIQNQ